MPDLPADYQNLNGAEKQRLIWERIQASEYPEGKLPSKGALTFYTHALFRGLLSVKHLRTSLTLFSDELPPGRTKIIHTFGSVCLLRFEPAPGHPFTGVFQSGALGLVRISLAYPPGSFCPGIGLKLFIDGHPSVNTVAMHSLPGQGADRNVFAKPNLNPAPTGTKGIALKILGITFNKTARSFNAPDLAWNHLPFNVWASRRSDGSLVENPCTPYGLRIVPDPSTQTSSDREPDFRVKLKGVPVGSKLWRVMALPSRDPDAEPIHAGDLISTSGFVASGYGDKVLFFQHPTGPLADEPAAT